MAFHDFWAKWGIFIELTPVYGRTFRDSLGKKGSQNEGSLAKKNISGKINKYGAQAIKKVIIIRTHGLSKSGLNLSF